MGANMARRLKDRGFHVTAVYDTNRAAATALASELGCAAAQDLSEVTAASDVIFTVVTDDNAMRKIFAGPGDNLLVNARGKLFINCATISPEVHVEIEKLAEKAGAQSLEACMASSITQAREGKLYLMCGGNEDAFRKAEPILKELSRPNSLRRQSRRSRQGESAGQHGHEHQHRRARRRPWARRSARPRPNDVARSFCADRRELARARDRRRRHAEPRAQLLFLRCTRGQRQRDRSRARAQSRPRFAARAARQRNNTTAWSRKTSASSTNPASPS